MTVKFNGRDCNVTLVGNNDKGTVVNGSPLFGNVYLLDDDGKDHTGEFRFAYKLPVEQLSPTASTEPTFAPPAPAVTNPSH